jgi:hypothetical protein
MAQARPRNRFDGIPPKHMQQIQVGADPEPAGVVIGHGKHEAPGCASYRDKAAVLELANGLVGRDPKLSGASLKYRIDGGGRQYIALA